MANSGWDGLKLADLCESIDYGFTTSAKEAPVGPKFLRITDIVNGIINWNEVPYCKIESDKKDKYRLSAGDVVIARTGATTGYSAFLASVPDAIFASYLVRLKIREPHSSRFVGYYLKGKQFWDYIYGVLGDKSAQPNASATTLTQAPIDVPPPPTQQRIARVLGTLDDKIELNRRMNRTLEKMAAALFKSWFIDFDPVRAKAEGRDTGLPQDIADLFPDEFEESELGEIPEGWTVKSLPEAIEVNASRSLSRGTAAPYVEMSAMPTKLSRPAGWPRREFSSGSKFRNGDVLVARITPCLENGKTAFVDFLVAPEHVGYPEARFLGSSGQSRSSLRRSSCSASSYGSGWTG